MRLLNQSAPARSSAKRGFTLAEVAVTIVIVGVGLVLVLQGLNTAKLTAAHTRNLKLARELALVTLGQIESGEYQEDIETGLKGSYAEVGHADFSYEVVVGEESFRTKSDDGTFDSWAKRDDSNDSKKDKDEEVTEEPFEKIKIRITFPMIKEFSNELILERWIPWKQVYGEGDSAKTDAAKAGQSSAAGTTSGGK